VSAFTNGTSVRVVSKCSLNGRTGVVIDDAPKFPWRDSRRVKFDEVPGKVKGELVPLSELRAIKLSERPAGALAAPERQLGLFGEAA
jgi:hypothetical protein